MFCRTGFTKFLIFAHNTIVVIITDVLWRYIDSIKTLEYILLQREDRNIFLDMVCETCYRNTHHLQADNPSLRYIHLPLVHKLQSYDISFASVNMILYHSFLLQAPLDSLLCDCIHIATEYSRIQGIYSVWGYKRVSFGEESIIAILR